MPSTAIRQLSYDEATRTLFVTFIDGDLYAYFEVPGATYAAFRAARSKGGFFAKHIRPKYGWRKVEVEVSEVSPSPSGPSAGPASPPPAVARR